MAEQQAHYGETSAAFPKTKRAITKTLNNNPLASQSRQRLKF